MAADAGSAGHRSGFVAIIGEPNCGKSTLLNQFLGQKIAIVTAKPQTTRTRILGIKTLPDAQIVFVDTPGIHDARDLLNRRMVDAAEKAAAESDAVLWLVDSSKGERAADEWIAGRLAQAAQCCVALNKIDLVQKPMLLPLMDRIGKMLPGREIVPISALRGENLDLLLRVVRDLLPEGPRYYPEEEVTDQTERALVSEIIREKVLLETREEVPYSVAVVVDSFEERPERNLVLIRATIHVNRESQKPILIGQGGSRIKRIGQRAREEIEPLLGRRVYLELYVRVQEGWIRDPRRLKEFGL